MIGALAAQDDYELPNGPPLPDVGDPLIPSGPQVSAGARWANNLAERLPRAVMGGIAQQVALPGQMMAPNPYPPGSELADFYDATKKQGATEWAPGMALNTMGTGAIVGAPVRGAEAVLGVGPIRAYHGSPHVFDKFDISKIGTGEGAQAYGHGLYFAENEGVARSYKAAGQPSYLGADRIAAAHDLLTQAGGDRQTAMALAQSRMSSTTKYGEGKLWQDVVNNFDDLVGRGPGHMYEVNINAEPRQFLDWDRALSAQPDVRSRVAPLLKEYGLAPSNYSGEGLQNEIVNFLQGHGMSKPHAAEAVSIDLRSAGIPGIKYLDQGSRGLNVQLLNPKETVHGDWLVKHLPNGGVLYRGPDEAAARAAYAAAPKPTSNYVVNDPGIIDILKKYGVVGAPAGGVIGGLAAQDNYHQ